MIMTKTQQVIEFAGRLGVIVNRIGTHASYDAHRSQIEAAVPPEKRFHWFAAVERESWYCAACWPDDAAEAAFVAHELCHALFPWTRDDAEFALAEWTLAERFGLDRAVKIYSSLEECQEFTPQEVRTEMVRLGLI